MLANKSRKLKQVSQGKGQKQITKQIIKTRIYQSFDMRTSKPVGVWTVFMCPDPIKSRMWKRTSRGENRNLVFSSEESSISLYFLRFNNEKISFLPWVRPFKTGPILGIENQYMFGSINWRVKRPAFISNVICLSVTSPPSDNRENCNTNPKMLDIFNRFLV